MVLFTTCISSLFSFPNYSNSPPLLFSSPPISNVRHFSIASKLKLIAHHEKSFHLLNDDVTVTKMSSKSNLDSQESPSFKMTLSQLLAESRIAPISISGDTDVSITGIQHDSREILPGDLFICCRGFKTDGHNYISEAIERGASAILTEEGIELDQTSNCKAFIIVEDTSSILPLLASTFFGHPSKFLSVIAITGTNGKTTTAHLVKSIIEATGSKTGTLGTLGYFIHGDSQVEEAPNTTPNAVSVQKLMAKAMNSGCNAVVMEASSHGLALGRCDHIDFNVAVFTNLTRDHLDFHNTEEEYRKCKEKLFARMVDPQKHRKVVNLDDPSANYFISQGNSDVKVVTFAMENKEADVKPLSLELSLFKTKIFVHTLKGVIEITSQMIGRFNVYNLLAAVAVGIAVDAPLEDIVRGIEGVKGVPGRCELIEEGQGFAVIVDYAHTPDALLRLLDAVRELNPRRILTGIYALFLSLSYRFLLSCCSMTNLKRCFHKFVVMFGFPYIRSQEKVHLWNCIYSLNFTFKTRAQKNNFV